MLENGGTHKNNIKASRTYENPTRKKEVIS